MTPPVRPPTWKQWKVEVRKRFSVWPRRIPWLVVTIKWRKWSLRSLRLICELEYRRRLDEWSRWILWLVVRITWFEWFLRWGTYVIGRYLPGVSRLVLLAVAVFALVQGYLSVNAYLADAAVRNRNARFQAWQVVHSAHGQRASGARIEALEFLNERNDRLDGLDLRRTDLRHIHLRGVRMEFAELDIASLDSADLRDADFNFVKLFGAHLTGANLEGAVLYGANLSAATMRGTNMVRTILMGARLCRSLLIRVNLTEADMRSADLTGATVTLANLTLTDLRYARVDSLDDWHLIRSIKGANVYKAKDTSGNFLKWAKAHGAVEIASDREWQAYRDSVLKTLN
jgi:uncharacterized protein YjbI with pentapeptide repeats